jgi:alkylhydroperoxidase domain protein
MTITSSHNDVLDALAGVSADSPLAALRRERSAATEHAQGSYNALFDPDEIVGLTQPERLAVALRVAELDASQPAIDHFRARLGTGGASERLPALLRHAELLGTRPVDANPDALQLLADAGLSTLEIVTLSQVIAFVSFFVRVLVTLELLGAKSAGRATIGAIARPQANVSSLTRARVIRPPADLRRPTAFTVQQLAWTPWLEPLDTDAATPEQRTVLDGDRAKSPYFRLLALDPDVLRERTATDRGIFYTPGGAPRAERELAAAATSRLNGCLYCTSVHAARAAQLSKRDADIDRLLRLGVTPGTDLQFDARWQAVVDASVALAQTPPVATSTHIEALRNAGMQDQEIFDILHAGAFFAWANRLMLTLGEPYSE